jgi:hypothetical protein
VRTELPAASECAYNKSKEKQKQKKGFLIGTVVYRGAPRIFGMVVQEAPPPYIYDNSPYVFYALVLGTYGHRTTWSAGVVFFFLTVQRRCI